ncbi:MAG: hypothetical protein KY476_16200 [Planctomycetes bacterium]|nr:hypothetical protein [Planctomycetota bacterium]
MAIRLLMLMATTTLFAIAWSLDRRSVDFNPHGQSLETHAAVEPRSRGLKSTLRAPRMTDTVPVTVESPPAEIGCEIPLPETLAPGEYRVVSSEGRVIEATLSQDDLEYHGLGRTIEKRDLYITDAPGIRWYFIRLDTIGPVFPLVERPHAEPVETGAPAVERAGVDDFGRACLRVADRFRERTADIAQRWARVLGEMAYAVIERTAQRVLDACAAAVGQ